MSNRPEHVDGTELSHSHSRLVWLIDEVDAHLQVLSTTVEEPQPIFEALVGFWGDLRDELSAHMNEEEGELFQTLLRLAPDAAADVQMLCDQHADLLAELEEFTAALASTTHEGSFGTLRESVARLRRGFAAHSESEREVLFRVEQRRDGQAAD